MEDGGGEWNRFEYELAREPYCMDIAQLVQQMCIDLGADCQINQPIMPITVQSMWAKKEY